MKIKWGRYIHVSTETTTGVAATETGAQPVEPVALAEVAPVEPVEPADGNQNTDQSTGQDPNTDVDPDCSGGGCPEGGQSA